MGLNYHAEAASKWVRHNEMPALDFGGARRRNLPRDQTNCRLFTFDRPVGK